jgi:hypothetical protein
MLMIITAFLKYCWNRLVSKKSNSEEDEDDFDEIDIDEDYEDIDHKVSTADNFDARRRLEQVLEDKALERLINGDLYD